MGGIEMVRALREAANADVRILILASEAESRRVQARRPSPQVPTTTFSNRWSLAA